MKGWTPAAINRWEHHALEQLAQRGSRSHADRLVHYLAKRWRKVPGLWECQQTIADNCDWSRRSVQSWQYELQELGVLDVEVHPAEHDKGTGRWSRRANRYRPRFCLRHEKSPARPPRAPRRPPMRKSGRQYVPSGYLGPGRQDPAPARTDLPVHEPREPVGDSERGMREFFRQWAQNPMNLRRTDRHVRTLGGR